MINFDGSAANPVQQTYSEWVAENIAYYQNLASEMVAYYRQATSENISYYQQAASEYAVYYSQAASDNITYYKQAASDNMAYYSQAASENITYYSNYVRTTASHYSQAAIDNAGYYLNVAKINANYYLATAKLNINYTVDYVKATAISWGEKAVNFVKNIVPNTRWAYNKAIENSQYYAARAVHYINVGFTNAKYYMNNALNWSWNKLVAGFHWGYAFALNRVHDLGRLISGIWDAFKFVARSAWSLLKEGVFFAGRMIRASFNLAVDGLKAMRDFVYQIPKLMGQAFDFSLKFMRDSWQLFKTALNSLVNALRFTIDKSMALVKAFLSNTWVLLKEGSKFVVNLLHDLKDAAINFIMNVPSYINRVFNAAITLVQNISSALVQAFNYTLNLVKSFSSTLVELTKSLGTLLKNLALDSFNLAVNLVKSIGSTLNALARAAGTQVVNMLNSIGLTIQKVAQGVVNVVKDIYANFGSLLPRLWQGLCNVASTLKTSLEPLGQVLKLGVEKALNGLGALTGVAKYMADKVFIAGIITYSVIDLAVGWVGGLLASVVPQAAVSFLTTTLPFGGLLATGGAALATGISASLTLGAFFFAGYGLYRGVQWAGSKEEPNLAEEQNERVEPIRKAANDIELEHRPVLNMMPLYAAERRAQQGADNQVAAEQDDLQTEQATLREGISIN